MRAVLDPNVIISAPLSPSGSPAIVLRAWQHGAYELVLSPALLAELDRALAYPKLRARITAEESREVLELLAASARMADDPIEPPAVRSPDPDDDYLVALAQDERAMLVSGDRHLLGLAGRIPVCTPTDFRRLLDEQDR